MREKKKVRETEREQEMTNRTGYYLVFDFLIAIPLSVGISLCFVVDVCVCVLIFWGSILFLSICYTHAPSPSLFHVLFGGLFNSTLTRLLSLSLAVSPSQYNPLSRTFQLLTG